MLDEVDEFETDGQQGDIMRLAERRTMSFGNRKIICGSTPILAESSYILKAFAAGNQKVFEVPCPSCGAFSEIEWSQIRWDEGKPKTAKRVCPACGVFHDESYKPAMIHAGRWRATRPEIKGHASFCLTALTSLLAKASWPILAEEFVEAKHQADKGETSGRQAFVNTALAQPRNGPGETVDDAIFASMIEAFSLDNMPPVAPYLFAGIDVQGDRLEISISGFDKDGVCHVLLHQRIWGSPDDGKTWNQLSQLLVHRWRHPWGGSISISATCIDSGYAFARASNRVYAIKGLPGNRAAIQRSTDKVVRGKSPRKRAGVSLPRIIAVEAGGDCLQSTAAAIVAALEEGGVVFERSGAVNLIPQAERAIWSGTPDAETRREALKIINAGRRASNKPEILE